MRPVAGAVVPARAVVALVRDWHAAEVGADAEQQLPVFSLDSENSNYCIIFVAVVAVAAAAAVVDVAVMLLLLLLLL